MASISFPDPPPPSQSTASGEFYQSNFAQPAGVAPPYNPNNNNPNNNPNQQQPQYFMPAPAPLENVSSTSFEDEPPLLEELGINVPAVLAKMRLVANPFSKIDSTFADDADMTGPVLLCLLLGFLLLLQRKIQFGVIYGQATFGCVAIYLIFNLMSGNGSGSKTSINSGIDLYRVTSILGYSMLPMVLLSLFAIFIPLRYRAVAISLGFSCIVWSTTMASKIFVAVLAMHEQFWLVWYPLFLLYTSFAFITVF